MPELQLCSVSNLFKYLQSPLNLTGNRGSFSLILDRFEVTVPPPLVQSGSVFCPPLHRFSMPEIALCYLPNAIITQSGAVIFEEKYVIEETVEGSLTDNGLKEVDGVISSDFEGIEEVDEVVANINRHGTWNYSLFIAEILPGALILQLNGLTQMRLPIYFKPFMTPQAVNTRYELLNAFGVATERTFFTGAPFSRFKGVLIAKCNDRYKNHRISQLMPYVAARLKNIYATSDLPRVKRFYVSRQHSSNRRVTNFNELTKKVFEPLGLQSIELDAMPLAEQIDLFSKADLVVGEHGAGLVNTIFMRPGSTVIEIFPEDLVGRWMYRLIAEMGKLKYSFGSFKTENGWIWNKDDIKVPCGLYQTLIDHNRQSLV